MKKQFKLWLVIPAIAGVIIAGCNSSDKKTGDATTSTDATTTVDSSNKMNSSTSTDTSKNAMKSNPGKKGKVSSMMSVAARNAGKMVVDKEGYYSSTEVLPAFPGGQSALDNYIASNIEYPQDALDNGIEGTVVVSFAVDENGKIYTPTVTSTKLGYGLEEAAIKAVSSMPVWTPGVIKGKNVKTRYTLPVKFQLEQ